MSRLLLAGASTAVLLAGSACTSAPAPLPLPPDPVRQLQEAVHVGVPEGVRRSSGAGRVPDDLARTVRGVHDRPVVLRLACSDGQPMIVQLEVEPTQPLQERLFACDGTVLRLRAPAGPRDAVTFRTSSVSSTGTYAYAWSVG